MKQKTFLEKTQASSTTPGVTLFFIVAISQWSTILKYSAVSLSLEHYSTHAHDQIIEVTWINSFNVTVPHLAARQQQIISISVYHKQDQKNYVCFWQLGSSCSTPVILTLFAGPHLATEYAWDTQDRYDSWNSWKSRGSFWLAKSKIHLGVEVRVRNNLRW